MKRVKDLMWLDEAKKKMKGEDPCWDNYEMVGTKKKNGKEVPNCVPKTEEVEGVAEEFTYDDEAKNAHAQGYHHGREGLEYNKDRAKAQHGENFKHYAAGFGKGRNERKGFYQGNDKKRQQGVAEDVEQVDELNKDTVYSYKKKSEKEEDEAHEKLEKEMKSGNAPAANKTGKKIMNRLAGQERAEKRLNSEEVVAEGSDYTPPKLGTIKANLMNTKEPTVQVQVFKKNTLRGDSYWVTKEVKKFKTKDQAQAYVDRMNKQSVAEGTIEETDQIDELSKTTLSSYVNKSFNDVSVKNKLADKHMAIASMHNKSSKPDAESKSIQNALIMKALAKQRSDRAQKALGKVYGVSEAAGDVNIAFTEAVKKDENVSTKDTKKGEKLSGKQEPIKINPPLLDGR